MHEKGMKKLGNFTHDIEKQWNEIKASIYISIISKS